MTPYDIYNLNFVLESHTKAIDEHTAHISRLEMERKISHLEGLLKIEKETCQKTLDLDDFCRF